MGRTLNLETADCTTDTDTAVSAGTSTVRDLNPENGVSPFPPHGLPATAPPVLLPSCHLHRLPLPSWEQN